MSKKDLDAYQAVEAKQKEYPLKSRGQLFEVTGINAASYYRGRKLALVAEKGAALTKKMRKGASVKEVTRKTETAAKPAKIFAEDHMIMLIGSPEQMKLALSGHM